MAGGAGRAPSCPGGEAGGSEGARGAPRGGVGCRRGCPRERPCSGLWLCPCSEEDSEGHGTGVSSTAGMPASPLPRGRACFTGGVVPWLREAKPLAQGQPRRWNRDRGASQRPWLSPPAAPQVLTPPAAPPVKAPRSPAGSAHITLPRHRPLCRDHLHLHLHLASRPFPRWPPGPGPS